jgi:hypothetical protein
MQGKVKKNEIFIMGSNNKKLVMIIKMIVKNAEGSKMISYYKVNDRNFIHLERAVDFYDSI